jgi:hypothetical protein
MMTEVQTTLQQYLQELVKYPPQLQADCAQNNPPLYDLLPQIKAAAEKRGTGSA